MKVHIFEGKKPAYGFTNDPKGANLPSEHGPWKHWKDKEINKGDKVVAADSDKIIDDISANGYHITGAVVTVDEKKG